MPIDEGVNVDLQFLILEVNKQAKASLSHIEKPSTQKLTRIRHREDYVNNLKITLENKSYFNIYNLADNPRKMNYFRALITIASNLERCADFFERIAHQMSFMHKPEMILNYELKRYYKFIYKALDIIYPALVNHDLDLAQKICEYETELDDLYDQSFTTIRQKLEKGKHVDDLLCVLSIIRYLERAGDSFLNIGEAILDIHVGEKMGIRQFRYLRRGLESLDIDISSENVMFKPIMNTRSGSRVARIIDGNSKSVFYKEGSKSKLDAEVAGLKLWQSLYPGKTPAILWQESRRQHSTILLEYLEGDDLLENLLQKRPKLDACLKLLTKQVANIWQSSMKPKKAKIDYVAQLLSRKSDIKFVHDHLFELESNLDKMLEEAQKMESKLRAPFSTLVHGDFNVDNIIFSPDNKKMYFIDVHRSGYGDYTQDVSVFLISNFRIPIFSSDIRNRLNKTNMEMFKCARNFARRNKDTSFEARLAFGLFRSLITSTRFSFNKDFSTEMFERAIFILRELIESKDDLSKFRISHSVFLYE